MSFRQAAFYVSLTTILNLSLLGSNPVAAKSFFWQAHSKTATVYLMGSIHLAKPDFYPLSDNIEKAFAQSSVLVVEINPKNIDTANMQAELHDNGHFPAFETLDEHVSEATFNLFKQYVTKNNLHQPSLAGMKPGLLSVTLSMIEMNKLGYKADLGVDSYFLNKAKDKTILELETYQQQLELFFELPAEEWYLKYTLERMGEMRENMEKITTAWKQGDISGMENIIINEIQTQHPELKPVHDKLFTQRNISMSKKITGYLQTDKTYFVVVGAGHLVGNQGIVSLLAKQGYNFEQN